MSIVNPPPGKQQIELVQLANNKRVMIDQIFKTILRGFRNFYRKLFKVYQQSHSNYEPKIKEEMLISFIQDLGLYKFIIE